MHQHNHSTFHRFLICDGAVGDEIRKYPWSSTELGPIEDWPAGLRLTLRLMLSSKRPMVLWWGPDYVHFHNDAYANLLNPLARQTPIGSGGAMRTDDVWTLIKDVVEQVMETQKPHAGSDTPLPLSLSNSAITYWDYELLPVDGGNDTVVGVLGVLSEVSAEHYDDERLLGEVGHLLTLFDQCPGFICVFTGPEHIYRFVNLEYRQLMGERNYLGRAVREVVPEVEGQGFFELLDGVYGTGESYVGKNLPMRYLRTGEDSPRDITVSLVYRALKSSDGSVFGIFVEGTSSGEQSLERVLSARERDVLQWIAAGKTASETAQILGVSKRTCEMHVYSAARKLQASNSTQTVVEAIKRGEIKVGSAVQ